MRCKTGVQDLIKPLGIYYTGVRRLTSGVVIPSGIALSSSLEPH